MKSIRTSILISIVWFLLVTILLCIPGSKLPKIGWVSNYQLDKLIHFTLFFILCWGFCSVSYFKNKSYKWFWLIAFSCSLYGMSMEFVQEKFIPNRSFDVWDIVADTVGSFGFLVYLNLYPKFFAK